MVQHARQRTLLIYITDPSAASLWLIAPSLRRGVGYGYRISSSAAEAATAAAMGNCFSFGSDFGRRETPFANVVSLAGVLRRYPIPVTASQVLCMETSSPGAYFLCDSDRLDFDDYVKSLSPDEELEPEQVYFVLPVYKLRRRLAAAEMAALAVKASTALNAASNQRRKRKARIIATVSKPKEDYRSDQYQFPIIKNKNPRRSFPLPAKLSVPSFKVIKLAPIDEESVLLPD